MNKNHIDVNEPYDIIKKFFLFPGVLKPFKYDVQEPVIINKKNRKVHKICHIHPGPKIIMSNSNI